VDHFKALVDSLPVMVCRGRTAGRGVDFVNQPFRDYTGLALGQLVGWGWADSVHPDDRERVIECAASVVNQDRSVETEMRLHRADGIYRWFVFRGGPRHDASGAVVGWCAVNTDIERGRVGYEARRNSVANTVAYSRRLSAM
jgi:PAS domain S-box-containing protein